MRSSAASTRVARVEGQSGIGLSDDGEDGFDLRQFFAVLEPLSENAQRKYLRATDRFRARFAVGKHARQVWHFSDPSTVRFLLYFDRVHH